MGLSGSNLYRLSGGTVIPASEALYPAEADLQQLIAENPQLLLGSPGDGQRLVSICCGVNSPCATHRTGQLFSPLTISSLTKMGFLFSSR